MKKHKLAVSNFILQGTHTSVGGNGERRRTKEKTKS
jgi:hypothetical protein